MEDFVECNVLDPNGVVQTYKDYYWWCVDGDPKRALFYRPSRNDCGSPQCNASKVIAERVGANLNHETRSQLIQIPLAFVPWDTSNRY